MPTPEVADQILKKLDVLHSIGDPQIEHAIAKFAKHFPGKVFLAMWRRQQRHEEEDSDFDVVPFDFHSIRFADAQDDPEAKSVIDKLEHRLISEGKVNYGEIKILHIAILQTAGDAERNLRRLLGKAKTAKQLERVAEFISYWHSWPVVLSCPDFTRELLQRARATDLDTQHKIFRRLQGLPGARGSSGYEPNSEWKALVEAIEKMAEKYKEDPELGALYAAAAKHEREWMKMMSRRVPEDDQELE